MLNELWKQMHCFQSFILISLVSNICKLLENSYGFLRQYDVEDWKASPATLATLADDPAITQDNNRYIRNTNQLSWAINYCHTPIYLCFPPPSQFYK